MIERIALGAVEHVGHGDHLDPAALLVESATGRAPRGHLPQACSGSSISRRLRSAPPDRREPAREGPRCDRPAVALEDAARERQPTALFARRTGTASRRRPRREDPAFLVGLVEDARELARVSSLSRAAGSDAKAVTARWRSTRDSPKLQSSSVPSICSRFAVNRPRRSGRVDPDERLGVQQQRL